MENLYNTIQEQQIISDFTSMSQEVLSALITELDLHMTLRDLQYCQNQYRMRERRNPTQEELRLLDTLYRHRVSKNEFHGLRTFYTSDSLVAQTYADLIAKATHIQRDNQPFTPAALRGVLTRALTQAGKKVSVPAVYVGEEASLRLLEKGCSDDGSVAINGITAAIGQNLRKPGSTCPKPQLTDQILLLLPSGLSPAAFTSAVRALPIPDDAQIVTIGEDGLLDALLKWDGVYLVADYLPQTSSATPITDWCCAWQDGLLLRVSGDRAVSLRDIAAAQGLTAAIIGKFLTNSFFTIRREGRSPIQFETSFLRAFSPILPIDAEIPGISTLAQDLIPQEDAQTVIADADCAPFATAIPHTPYALQQDHILTGATVQTPANTFRSSLLATVHAINCAAAAGVDYNTLTLSHHLLAPDLGDRNLAVGEMMAAILGTYRVQAELAIPDVNSKITTTHQDQAKAHLTVFAAAPKPEKLIPHTFTSSGSNVYLLAPLMSEETIVDFEDYRKLLRYVHRLCEDGIALSAIAVKSDGIRPALRAMTQNGYGFLANAEPPCALCAFLLETQQPIQGTLIGVTTATNSIKIGDYESSTAVYRLPALTEDRIPMSYVGVEHPILCLPQTSALGAVRPIRALAEQHHATFASVPLNDIRSRTQLTNFANTMAQANITVIVGSNQELETILSNRRVSFAKDRMLSVGGILLCLHTDWELVKNSPIKAEHPLFYGIPALLYENAGIRFDPENDHVVHMRADSMALSRMLSCVIAYFQ